MHFPVKFRVLSMRADLSSHSVELQEMKTGSTLAGGSARGGGSDSPPISLFYEVDPETFGCIRVGQEFELSPTLVSQR